MRTKLELAGCIAALIAPILAYAQGAGNWPARAVTVVMPNSPGVAADIETRAFTDKLADSLGQPFVLDYKPGAGTMVSLTNIARAKPDGHILGMANINLSLVPLKFPDAPFDYLKGFEYVSLITKRNNGILITTQLPIHSIKEYIAYAKAYPGKINFTASGEGSTDHITGLWLMSATGTQVTFIHYKDSKNSQLDLMAGRSHMAAITYSEGGSAMILIKEGKMRSIATAAAQRSPLAPDVPTIAEQGIKDFDAPSFLGMLAPATTPPAIVNRLQREIVRIAGMPETQKAVGMGTVLVASTPAEFRQTVQSISERYRKLLRDNNINLSDK